MQDKILTAKQERFKLFKELHIKIRQATAITKEIDMISRQIETINQSIEFFKSKAK